ncbi:MAG: tetratricopeptide repeat protein, partial [Candidatus Hydrogenedentota bacterium]
MSSPSGRTIHPERSKKDASLFNILAGIVIVGIVAVGVIQFSVWFQNRITNEIEAEAVDTLPEAERLILSGDADGALELLAPILDRVDNPDITPKALLLQAQIHQDAERLEKTKIVLKQIIDMYSDSTEYPTAATRYARLLEEEGSMPEALALYREIRATAPSALRAPA